jgi:hypothetical protein
MERQEDVAMMDETRILNALMDTLLPGGEGFPPASATGTAHMLLPRLRMADAALPGELTAAIAAQGSLPTDKEGWRAAVARLEAVEPKLFVELRKYAYLTYYEQPETIAAIRALGLRYNSSPLPEGYPTEPFSAERDGPRHRRGRWIATADVRPIDVSVLDLEEVR